MRKQNIFKVLGVFVALLIIIVWLVPFAMIGPGERGVVIRLGAVQDRILGEGLHFIVPGLEKVVTVNVKTQKIEVDAPSFSKDIQNVDTRIALNYHIDPRKVDKLWQEIGRDYDATIIAPAIQESVKSATAQFTAAQLVSERALVKNEITRILEARLGPRYITVDDFSIINFNFSDSYEKAVEEKQVAQQQALKAENDLRRIQVEAEQRMAQAKAEAEAIRIQTEALTDNQNLISLEAVKKWNGILPQFMMGNAMPFIDISRLSSSQQKE